MIRCAPGCTRRAAIRSSTRSSISTCRIRQLRSFRHAVDRRLDQLAVVGLFHIVRPQPLEHVAEQAELAIGVGVGRLCACPIEQGAGRGCDQRHGYACRRTEENQGSFAHHPRTFWPSFTAHHGPGSTGIPSLRNSTYSTGWRASPALESLRRSSANSNGGPPSSPSSATSRNTTAWAEITLPMPAAMPSTPCSPPPATTFAASSHG